MEPLKGNLTKGPQKVAGMGLEMGPRMAHSRVPLMAIPMVAGMDCPNLEPPRADRMATSMAPWKECSRACWWEMRKAAQMGYPKELLRVGGMELPRARWMGYPKEQWKAGWTEPTKALVMGHPREFQMGHSMAFERVPNSKDCLRELQKAHSKEPCLEHWLVSSWVFWLVILLIPWERG